MTLFIHKFTIDSDGFLTQLFQDPDSGYFSYLVSINQHLEAMKLGPCGYYFQLK